MTSSLSLPPMPSSSTLGGPSPALPPTAFISLPPSSLPIVLADESALILDIRPHNSYSQARVPNSLCLSVPSTLLKRPNFPLARLAEMLPTSAARDKFARWPHASRILVYDADSAALPPTSNLLGLMRKFRNEGFPDTREIAWLRSGFHAVWREHPTFVEHGPPPDEDDATGELETDGDPAPLGNIAPGSANTRVLRAKHLPKAAFTAASTIPLKPRGLPAANIPLQLVPPTPAVSRECLSSSSAASLPLATSVATVPPPLATSSLSGPPAPGKARRGQFNLRLPPGLVQPKTASGAPLTGVPHGALFSMPTLSPPYSHPGSYENPSFSLPGRQIAFNPFFDTIRQNIELGSRDAKTTHSEGIPLRLSRRVRRRVGELPFEWLRQIARKSRHVSADEGGVGSDSDGAGGEESVSAALAASKAISEANAPLPRPSQANVTSAARRSPQLSPFSSPTQPVPMSSSPQPGPLSPASTHGSQSPPDADDLTRLLESQFYSIELGEQKRLLGVMERHSMESGKVIHEAPGVRGFVGIVPPGPGKSPGSSAGAGAFGQEPVSPFPFSITAGLEKGAKNRYRNIWPFEHARVRLRKAKPEDDDYMNASYVQPLGTTKRYIATQGPLPTTFTDFWTLCWEQNVHVIVMLTREIEGSSVKCGKYWEDGTYGTLRLKLLETNDTPERERKRRESEIGGGFFSQYIQHAKAKTRSRSKGKAHEVDQDTSTIKRVFELTNVAYPHAPPRIVTQFQYLEWPDLNVPEDPHGVLNLMRQVEDAVELSHRDDHKPWGEGSLRRRSIPPLHGNTVVASQGRCMDEVDPLTGIAMIARDNAPLLLHCSAGVGRTGGFIAVDAVLDGIRREMRKRKEGIEQDTADAQAASERGQGRCGLSMERSRSNSHGQSRSRSLSVMSTTLESEAEQMEVDPPASALGEAKGSEKAPLTLPVSVGDQEVHVPVAGFTGPVPMEVDGRPEPEKVQTSPTSPAFLKRATLPPPLLQASPELVEEVRRATLNRDTWTSVSPTTPSTAKGEAADHRFAPRLPPSEASSDSYPGRSHSGSARTRKRSRSRSQDTASASPPTSHADSTTNSMVGKTAKLSMTSPSPSVLPEEPSIVRERTASSLPSSASEQHVNASAGTNAQVRPSMSAQSHRLNTWRSEVHSSSDAAPSPAQESSSAVGPQQQVDTPYPLLKEPRKLHDDASPPLLSSYDEPIRSVVEDMREQRMSLCQSLRQYVFVHRAIIEGALMIVDEEKRREAGERAAAHSEGPLSGRGKAREHLRKRSAPDSSSEEQDEGERTELEIDTTSIGVRTTSPGRAKRGASPTELTKESLDGGVLLTKRPSLKKHGRQKTGEFEPLVADASMMSL